MTSGITDAASCERRDDPYPVAHGGCGCHRRSSNTTTMRFVQIRQPEQSTRQALHRVRVRYMGQGTGLVNQIRGFLLEFGIPIRRGAGVFRIDLPRVLGDEENELPTSMRRLLTDLWNDFKTLEARIEGITQQIQRSVQYSDTARRLMPCPASVHWPPVLWKPAPAMVISSPTDDTLPLGWGWCLASITPVARQPCSPLANVEIHT